jgi:hypothetical protein
VNDTSIAAFNVGSFKLVVWGRVNLNCLGVGGLAPHHLSRYGGQNWSCCELLLN